MTVVSVDYNSLESLTNALKGQEAIVSTLASAAIATQLLLIEAAAKAGVQRFIPSEFGSNTVYEKTRALPVFKDKATVQDALKEKSAAANSGISYTLICTGPFFDWGISVGFIINLAEKSIDLYDGGDRLFSTTTLPTIAKAVAAVLKKPEQTKNRAVYVQDTATTLNKLASVGKEVTGPDGWKENVVSIDDLVGQAWAELKKEKPNPGIFIFNFLKASIWGEGYGGHFEPLDNELLGIKEKTDEEIRALVASLAK